MAVAKGRDRGHREAKKPKADKKPTQATTSFLRTPQPAPPKPVEKDRAK
jgi:hypothetical protein